MCMCTYVIRVCINVCACIYIYIYVQGYLYHITCNIFKHITCNIFKHMLTETGATPARVHAWATAMRQNLYLVRLKNYSVGIQNVCMVAELLARLLVKFSASSLSLYKTPRASHGSSIVRRVHAEPNAQHGARTT